MNPAVSLEHLTFTYRNGTKPAIRDVQGEIEEGSFVVIMGCEGAGKSSLCYSLNGLIPKFFKGDYQGKVLVKGFEVSQNRVSDMAHRVGLVFQDFETQLFSTNVELEMAFGPENLCLPRSEIERRIRRYLSLVGLTHLRHRDPSTLSGGQKQRLAIGSVLALEPDLLVMDEPTTDLDPRGRQDVLSLTKTLRKKNQTLLMVDHEPETAVEADWVWLMQDGQVVSQGTPSEILTDGPAMERCGVHPHPLVKLFDSMNWPGRPLTVRYAQALIEDHHLIRREDLRRPPEPREAAKGLPILKGEGLGFHYPGFPAEALGAVDVSIYEGEFVAILGQNGSGKTTLAKHFNGLLKPTSGQMLLQGKPTAKYRPSELARRVGYVFQNPDHQIFAPTVFEEVGFGLKMLREDARLIKRRVAEALGHVGLEGYEEKPPLTLTKGERQRVAVASVLATQPQVIILDEPTTGLDACHQQGLMEMLKRLNQAGHTLVMITHSMGLAAEYAHRLFVMKDGSVLLDGPTRAVFMEEDRLAEASLYPSSLVKLSNWLGTQALTVPQLVEELGRNERVSDRRE